MLQLDFQSFEAGLEDYDPYLLLGLEKEKELASIMPNQTYSHN